jgi:hypothetical protein
MSSGLAGASVEAASTDTLGARAGAALIALAALADVGFLHAVWSHFDHWGIWDWDFYAALIEAGRRSILDFGQLPLWNPWVAGGQTLVGHPITAVFAPSMLPVLAFGTVAGLKIVILLYLLIAQVGTFLLARRIGLNVLAAVFAALVFSWGGVFAQHLAHGHLNWIAHAWIPFVLVALHSSMSGLRVASLGAGGLFLALSWLDGGPYHYVMVPFFVGLYAVVLSLQAGTLRPMLALPIMGVFGAALAAIELLPVAEMIFMYPRKTPPTNRFYGATFHPSAFELLYHAFLSRAQAHNRYVYMPYIINVGAYVGILPLVAAGFGAALKPRETWPMAILFVFTLLVCLGDTLPIDLWALLHRLPGFDSMLISTRMLILPLLCLAVLAGAGLHALGERPWIRPRARWVASGVVGLVALDLLLVNGPIWRGVSAVPPIEIEPRADFVHRATSRHRVTYQRTSRLRTWPNWPTASFPSVLENTGVIHLMGGGKNWPATWPNNALPFRHPSYPGAEVFAPAPGSEVRDFQFSPNRIRVRTSGGGGSVVINQNYHSGWTVVSGDARSVVNRGGLIGVEGIPPGERAFTVAFRPVTFSIGSAIGVAAIAIFLACLRWERVARRPDATAASRQVPSTRWRSAG